MVERSAAHQPSPSPSSSEILLKIVEKERDLENSILQAREEANRIIQEAKSKAAEIAATHKKSAEAQAVKIKEDMVKKARDEADRIRQDVADKIKSVQSIPPGRIDETVNNLLEMVLPPGSTEGDAR